MKPSTRRRVLVVDDDPALRRTLVDILSGNDFHVVGVATGKTALKRLAETHFNVALIDLKLADIPGLELLQRIRESTPDTACIVLTGHASLDAAVDAVNLGAYSFIRKPYAPERLLLTITHACEQYEREATLREREALYRAVTEYSHHGIAMIDDQYRFIYVNEPLCRLTGYSQEEVIGHDFRNFVDDESRGIMSERYARRQRGEDVPPRYEFGLIRKDGELRRMEISVSVVYDIEKRAQTVCHLRDITDERQAEEELRESEERYRRLVELTPDAIAVHREGRFVFVNSACLKLIGAKELDELIGKPVLDVVHPDYHANVRECIARMVSSGDPSPLNEEQMIRLDGEIIDVEVQAVPITFQDQTAIQMLVHDVTTRKRARRKLEISEEHYRSLFDGVPVGLYRTTPDGTAKDVNSAMVQILGYPDREALLAVNAADLYVDPADRKRWQERLEREGKVIGFEVRMKRHDGTPIWLRNSTQVVRDDDGRLLYYEGSLFDITSRYEAETAREESEARYRRVSALTSDYAYAFRVTEDEELAIDWITGAYEYITGYDSSSLVARGDWENLIHTDDLSDWLGHIKRLLAGKANTVIYRIRTRRREVRWMRDHGVPEADEETHRTTHIYGAVQDITEQKQAEEGLNRSLDDLKRSNRDLEHFAYVASHDLQEPLRMVSSYVQLLAKRYKGRLDDDADEFIKYAADGAQRMQVLINDLLSFSRIRTHGKAFAEVDCEALITTLHDDLQIAITEKGGLITHDPLPTVMGDRSQLAHLLQNLLSNSLKFRSAAQPKIHIGAERMAKEWVFSVRDNGIGIDPQYHDRIFVIFRRLTTSDRISGTGIGLALCKNIVERHGGRIWVESHSGEGATFYFTIPFHKADEYGRVTS